MFGWWLDTYQANVSSKQFFLRFADGRYYFELIFDEYDEIAVHFYDEGDHETVRLSTNVKVKTFERMLIDGASAVIAKCESIGWEDDDLDKIRDSIGRYRDYGFRRVVKS